MGCRYRDRMTSPGSVSPTIVRSPGDFVERMNRGPAGPAVRAIVSRVRTPSWRRAGCPAPAPPHVKQRLVLEQVKSFRPSTFVETGTYRGDTIAVVRKHVARSVSIELDETLCALARRRFRRHSDVEILWGDSGTLMASVVEGLVEPAAFWLDGHYSGGVTADRGGDAPILSELEAVLASPTSHLILIDDARLFDGTNGYPTLDVVKALVVAHRPDAPATTENDIVVCRP